MSLSDNKNKTKKAFSVLDCEEPKSINSKIERQQQQKRHNEKKGKETCDESVVLANIHLSMTMAQMIHYCL